MHQKPHSMVDAGSDPKSIDYRPASIIECGFGAVWFLVRFVHFFAFCIYFHTFFAPTMVDAGGAVEALCFGKLCLS